MQNNPSSSQHVDTIIIIMYVATITFSPISIIRLIFLSGITLSQKYTHIYSKPTQTCIFYSLTKTSNQSNSLLYGLV